VRQFEKAGARQEQNSSQTEQGRSVAKDRSKAALLKFIIRRGCNYLVDSSPICGSHRSQNLIADAALPQFIKLRGREIKLNRRLLDATK